MIFDGIIDWVKRLFGKKPIDSKQAQENSVYSAEYEDIRRINFTAIFAEALATRALADSSLTVTGADGRPNRRAGFVADGVALFWRKGKRLVAQSLGKGGKVLVPYIRDGKPRLDTVDQSRMVIAEASGGEITSASLLAEAVTYDDKVYMRWIDYTLTPDGVHRIVNRATLDTGAPVPLVGVPQWAGITEEIAISNVEHLLFAYLKSPVDNRTDRSDYGVPITYGAGALIEQIYRTMDDIAREYDVKKAFVGADDRLFGKGGVLPEGGLFKKLSPATGLSGETFWEVFDPAIRDSSYYNRLEHLFALLEKAVGTSRGILTAPDATRLATATEIRAAQGDTFALIDDIRTAVEDALNRLAYAYDVLAEFYGLTPAGARGDYSLSFDWDYSMLESSSETFDQLSELESRGLIKGARLAAWVTGESIEDAQAEIDEVKASAPGIEDVLGGE